MAIPSVNDKEYDLWKKLVGNSSGFGPTPPPSNPDFFHILITGQSLAVGVNGLPLKSIVQPYSNLMFVGGVRAESGELGSAVPLVETSEPDPVDGSKTDAETVASGMSNEIARTSSRKIIASCSGLSGALYSAIKKGTPTYALLISQTSAAQAAVLAASGFDVQKVLCVAIQHGEANQAFEVPNYDLNLAQWQDDLSTDIKAATGQADDVPIFIYQQCQFSPGAASSTSFATALKALMAARANPSKIVLVGPNFMWLRSDGIHLSGDGYRSMGCLYSRIIKRVMIDNLAWSPFAPTLIIRTGNIVDVTYSVPTPPLVFDLESILNPGNYGFSYKDDNNDTTISSVAILNSNTVRITLSGTPTGTNKRLRYGFTATGVQGGPFTSGRGNLCDSSAVANAYGYQVPMKNWACLSDDPIPYGP